MFTSNSDQNLIYPYHGILESIIYPKKVANNKTPINHQKLQVPQIKDPYSIH